MISNIKAVVFGLGAVAMAGIGSIAPASASIVTYNFSAPGFWSGTFSLDVKAGSRPAGQARSMSRACAPRARVDHPVRARLRSPAGYRANDGTDWFGINQNAPIDSDGLLFDVGASTPVWGGFPIFPIYASGPGTYQSGLFGHIDGGPEFYEYNIATTLGAATPEPGTWAMLIMGFAGIGFVGNRSARQRCAAPSWPEPTIFEEKRPLSGLFCFDRRSRRRPPYLSSPPISMYLISTNSSTPWREPSRPMPDSFTPPNGASSLEIAPVLIPTMPYSSASATRHTRPRSRA